MPVWKKQDRTTSDLASKGQEKNGRRWVRREGGGRREGRGDRDETTRAREDEMEDSPYQRTLKTSLRPESSALTCRKKVIGAFEGRRKGEGKGGRDGRGPREVRD